jgi:excisionase family DNA binding protein
MTQQCFSIAEAAALLGVHRSSVYRRVVAGEMKVLQGLGIARIPASEIDRYLHNTTQYQPKQRSYK